MEEKVMELKGWIRDSENIVFFGGAGVSTESGIPDFRSVDGLYSQEYKYPPETILSHRFLEEKPEEFFRFYRAKMIKEGIEPNAAHRRLAELESEGKVRAVVTQNIDGLHQQAGSKRVLELHGSTQRNYCIECGARYGAEAVVRAQGIPRCGCGGMIRPEVVLYGEGLDTEVMQAAARYIAEAGMLIVGGTSLAVYPAAGLVDIYKGKRLVVINKGETRLNRGANLVIDDKIGAVFAQV